MISAVVLEEKECEPGKGIWRRVAVIDVRLRIHGMPFLLREITVMSQQNSYWFSPKAKYVEGRWYPLFEAEEHYEEFQDALRDAWKIWCGNAEGREKLAGDVARALLINLQKRP
jgi:hypothetical protein